MMTPVRWIRGFLLTIGAVLIICAVAVIVVDPFFHYHAPLSGLFYTLGTPRDQNDGITRHFDYDAVITGTSMAESFRVSEFDTLFETHAIKVCYPGATLKETGDNLAVAFRTNPDIRMVLRSLDFSLLLTDPDALREDMGTYPVYLTNRNPFDDVQYWWNRDVLISYTLRSLIGGLRGTPGGVTSFDEYGFSDVLGDGLFQGDRKSYGTAQQERHLTEEERRLLQANLEQNVCAIARAHPETRFVCFFPPYSMAYWGERREEGTLAWTLEMEEAAIRQLIEVPNIELYSFQTDIALTGDLTRYRDPGHYDYTVNSLILGRIFSEPDRWRLTQENLAAYLTEEAACHRDYDYNSLLK